MKDDKQILLVAQKNAEPGRSRPRRHLPRRHGLQRPAAAQAARRHGQGAGRGQRPRPGSRASSTTRRFFQVQAEVLTEAEGEARETEALVRAVVGPVRAVREAQQEGAARGPGLAHRRSTSRRKLADTVAAHLSLKISDKQELLETGSAGRAPGAALRLHGERDLASCRWKSASARRVKRQMEKTQREYYLNEQMKAIQKELGELEDGKDEASELEQRIKKTKLSKEARDKARAELKKLRTMSPMSAEATVVRNYLDWMLSLPWKKRTKVSKDIKSAQSILDDGPLRPREGQGADRRVPRGAAARRQDEGPDPVPGRPARRRQDLARQVAGPGHRAQLRPRLPRRHPRRGRDPRPPPDLHRLDARQDHPVR